ncbi:hypothetical protein AY601_1911 [Pedobacter cryoconitis]|uniref:Uncharacterized protein n=1 Tax=Pedobacter cryoconitis TaxID=188932 RepID=A0A127VD09_9SPHI|nr:hypothetical protein [Pedobacter cryoconitis]AMP98818.1 hypothetical protein AY601_1911 [Pedobacter cryoconitis]
MKRLVPLLLFTLLFACKNHSETKRIKGDLNYIPVTMESEQIIAGLYLTADIQTQELRADIDLSNPGSDVLTISEIEIATAAGLRSLPLTGSTGPIVLKPGENKSLSLKFQPLNDLKTNQLTGRNGYFKSLYNLVINYKTKDNKPATPKDYSQDQHSGSAPTVTSMTTALAPDDYKAYLKKYQVTANSYSFNTSSDFTKKQQAYLSGIKQVKQPPFVYVSAQEIAVSGVNFKLRSYQERDTLNAEIFIVNHSGFPLKINKDNLDISYTDESPSVHLNEAITVEKISGSKQDLYTLEKGDRVLIRLKKPFKTKAEKVILSFNKVFEFNNQTPLFNDNIELVKVNLP